MKALAVLVVALAALAVACSSSAEPESEFPPTEPALPTEPSLRSREPSFTSVFFIDESRGWLTGYLGPDRGQVILRTTDGGETWDEQYAIDLLDGWIGRLQFADERTGWAVVSESRSLREANPSLLGTTDAGATWTALSKLESFSSPQFVTESIGWRSTSDTAGADLMQTNDGGRTWQVVPTKEDIWSVCFADELRGWTARTDGTVLRTEDGGRT